MHKLSVLFVVIALSVGSYISPASAADLPEGPPFKSSVSKTVVLRNCPLVLGGTKIIVPRGGRRIQLPAKRNRKGYKLPQRYRRFTCRDTGDGYSIFAKQSRHADVAEFDLSLTDFPKKSGGGGGKGLGSACPGGVRSVGFGFLWKPASDTPDSRGGKPVVLVQGSFRTGSRGTIQVFSGSGKAICNFAFKQGQVGINGGADHYYSGWTGGCGLTGSQLGATAGGSVYVQGPNRTCIGPINPSSRNGAIGG